VSARPEPKSQNIVWNASRVGAERRAEILGHRAATLWLTGLSGSGKSTIANALEERLAARGINAYGIDGDNVRHGLNADLGFSAEDRTENIRRVGEVCRLFHDAGMIAITAFISPYRSDRDRVRAIHPEGGFLEVFVDCPLEECERRDVKGLYGKARAGAIPEFTGISSPYEPPANPEVVVRTAESDLDSCVAQVIDALERRGIIPRRS
jgi:adenylylsulfate kinase